MGELHTGSIHPLSDADPDYVFNLHMVPLDANQKERVNAGTWRSMTRLTPGGWGLLALDGCPYWRREVNNKPMGKRESSVLVGNSPRRREL